MEERVAILEFQAMGFDGHLPYELTVPLHAEIRNIACGSAEVEYPLGNETAVFEYEGKMCVCPLQVFVSCTAPALARA
jgi:hypothetical protein